MCRVQHILNAKSNLAVLCVKKHAATLELNNRVRKTWKIQGILV